MIKFTFILFFVLVPALPIVAQIKDHIGWRGQASAWANVNPGNDLPFWMGLRYIPQLNINVRMDDDRLLDFEFSANINGSGGIKTYDEYDHEGNIKPYRVWARYSGNQFEVRMGLQKINFGSASMLRPLMWFDQVDPRDPLQLTDGVWGVLGRYYFLNNVNIWIWGLYGNKGPKTWEIGETRNKTPEFGGRLQVPVPRGEAALSFHHRKADLHELGISFLQNDFASSFFPVNTQEEARPDLWDYINFFSDNIPENRLGFDAKWDVETGLWIEATWIQKRQDLLQMTNQHLFTLGADYTFDIGNGMYLRVEQILISMDRDPFEMGNRNNFTAATLSYPLGIFDNISAIVYRDWTNRNTYNFINWQRTFDRFIFYLMAFWNPETFRLPQQSDGGQMFSGKGFQLMIVFNH